MENYMRIDSRIYIRKCERVIHIMVHAHTAYKQLFFLDSLHEMYIVTSLALKACCLRCQIESLDSLVIYDIFVFIFCLP